MSADIAVAPPPRVYGPLSEALHMRSMRERYDIPSERNVGADVDSFLGELGRRGLLAQ